MKASINILVVDQKAYAYLVIKAVDLALLRHPEIINERIEQTEKHITI